MRFTLAPKPEVIHWKAGDQAICSQFVFWKRINCVLCVLERVVWNERLDLVHDLNMVSVLVRPNMRQRIADQGFLLWRKTYIVEKPETHLKTFFFKRRKL